MSAAGPQAALLPDGRRLHLQHGPIDLIIGAEGADVAGAYARAARRFATVLDELCGELPALRAGARPGGTLPRGIVARRMARAVAPFSTTIFITPMAAVAGAVADEILTAMTAGGDLRRAYVNNGGDIALHLRPGEDFTIGMVDRPDRPGLFGHVRLSAESPVRGLATSGWRGRSFSLGIADAVTVLARSAATADAAATVIANAVDLPGHPAIRRAPAQSIQADSDLGERLVTRAVGALNATEIEEAVSRGMARARRVMADGLVLGVAIHLASKTDTLGITDIIAARPANPPIKQTEELAHA